MHSTSLRFSFTIIVLLVVMNNNVCSQKSSNNASDKEFRKFRTQVYNDSQGTGIEAFRFLMPSDWQFDGGIQWILDNPAMPAVTRMKVYDPKGTAVFEVFPNECYFWTTNTQLLGMFPPGSKYFGSVVKAPIDARHALRQVIIPGYRSGMQNVTVIKDENLPELPAALGAAQQQGSAGPTGAKIRISYVENGRNMEEEFYAMVDPITFPVQGMFQTNYNTIWFIDYIFSCRAEKGKLDAYTSEFQTITSSFKVNPKWYAKYSNVIVYMAQQQISQIRSIGEFSRMLSQMSDQMSDDQMRQFEQRSNVYDDVSQKFSDTMLGIDRYYDPHQGREVELPSGYENAWSNNNGEYIVTDDPNFNPNVGSNLHWEKMGHK